MNKTKSKAPVMIPVDNIVPFKGHPYKVLDDDSMNELIDSVQDNGILEPITVRPLENTENYEIISGHRRYRAAQKAGLTEVPAFIRAVSRDEAAVMLVDSNLHRERILPSEKAFAYKLKMDALTHQGVSRQLGEKWSVEQVAESMSESARQVHRYIRLTNLVPELLDLMDEGKIAFSVGVELSYLDDQHQNDVLDACEENENTPSYAQAVRMHKAFNSGELDRDGIDCIMSEEKPNQHLSIKIPLDRIEKIIPYGFDSKKTEDYVVKALEFYHRYLMKQREQAR